MSFISDTINQMQQIFETANSILWYVKAQHETLNRVVSEYYDERTVQSQNYLVSSVRQLGKEKQALKDELLVMRTRFEEQGKQLINCEEQIQQLTCMVKQKDEELTSLRTKFLICNEYSMKLARDLERMECENKQLYIRTATASLVESPGSAISTQYSSPMSSSNYLMNSDAGFILDQI